MLRKRTPRSGYSHIAVTRVTRDKISQFSKDTGYTIESIAETAINIFMDSFPELEIRNVIVYNKDVLKEKIVANRDKLKPIRKIKPVKEAKKK